jgi:hypothetical protein
MIRRIDQRVRSSILCLALLGAASASQAYVECVVNPSKYFIGADGLLYVMWTQGGAGRAFPTSPGYRGILATVLTAMNSNRRLVIRLDAGANCAVENNLVGVWIET